MRPSIHGEHDGERTRDGNAKKTTKSLLDDTNKTIIKQLQADGRRSYVSIGKLVGLSEAAVRSRVQRLTEAGVIQIVAVTDPLELGYSRQAMIGVTINGDVDAIERELKTMVNIDYIVVTAGRFDLLLEVFCASDEDLLELVSRIRMIPGIERTEIFTYLKLALQHYNFGVQ